LPASLSTVCPVFTLGIFPRKVLYSPAKEPLYEAKVGYFCSEKLSASGASPPDPTNRGSAPGPHCENSPRPPSSHVPPLMSTVSGVRHRHPQFLAVWCQNIVFKGVKSFSFWGTSSPRPPTGALPLDHTGELPKFLSPSSRSCIKWQ